MDFAFTEEQQLFAQTVRRFAREQLLPHYATWDDGTPFPAEKLKALGDLGIVGLRVPERYGGTDASFVMAGIASEELARGDFNTTYYLQIAAIVATLLTDHATESVQDEWLPKLAAGDTTLAFGLTEPGAGSDAAAIQTRARRDGDDWLISGEKASITFAGIADACVVFARSGDEGARGISAILVPLDQDGVTRQTYASAGSTLTARGSLFFDDARAPLDHLLGEEGRGFYQAMDSFDYNRAIIALACLGAARQSIDETIEYVKQRHTFGQPLAKREGIAFQIAEHLTLIEAARLLAYQTLWLRDQNQPHIKEAAMAKWLGPKTATEAIHASLLMHGHYGYSKELPFEQRLRDVIGLEIGDGTPEIMKGVIAREAIGRDYTAYR
jgi:cyclohexanecarboxyl-CoA dehydrogenase